LHLDGRSVMFPRQSRHPWLLWVAGSSYNETLRGGAISVWPAGPRHEGPGTRFVPGPFAGCGGAIRIVEATERRLRVPRHILIECQPDSNASSHDAALLPRINELRRVASNRRQARGLPGDSGSPLLL